MSSENSTEKSSENTTEQENESETDAPVTDRFTGLPDGSDEYMDIVVPEQASAVDDSYFEDAVFIGDSRMQGFRNLSGITKGSFVTAVGMELENFYTDSQIATAAGNVTVLDALKNINFSKIQRNKN